LGLFLALSAAVVPGAAWGDMHEFPSGGSDLNGVTDIGGGQIGWFWRSSLNQSVSEILADTEPKITRAILDIEVPQNVLVSDPVEWAITINNSQVGSFTVDPGFTGPVHLGLSFARISAVGGNYEVSLEVVNDVALMGGAHTLGFADPYKHSVELIPEPTAAALLSGWVVVLVRRRRSVRKKPADGDR